MSDLPKVGQEWRVAFRQDDGRLIYGPWLTPIEARADYEAIRAKVNDPHSDVTYVALYFCATLSREHSEDN